MVKVAELAQAQAWRVAEQRFARLQQAYERAAQRAGSNVDLYRHAVAWLVEIGDPLRVRLDSGERTADLLEELRTVE